jgi:hypothetical protein
MALRFEEMFGVRWVSCITDTVYFYADSEGVK